MLSSLKWYGPRFPIHLYFFNLEKSYTKKIIVQNIKSNIPSFNFIYFHANVFEFLFRQKRTIKIEFVFHCKSGIFECQNYKFLFYMFSAAVQLTLKHAVVVMVHKHNLVFETQEEGRCLWLYISLSSRNSNPN